MNKDIVLLPHPRMLVRIGGTHTPTPGRRIWLAGKVTRELLRTGRIVQEALAILGSAPELTAYVGSAPGGVSVTLMVDPGQVRGADGYRLEILPDEIRITGHDDAGAFYAAMTLRQIARQAQGAAGLPCLRIEDRPDFPHRGVMLDISRDKVPTMETLYALVDMLAEWKVNQLQLYTEHTFAYREHEEVWKDASPMTGEQVMELDAYCRDRFVELAPNQNSFGHMERWLMHPSYRDLAEEPESPIPRALDPSNPRSIDFIAGLFDELLPHFSSRQFNVGLDEVLLGGGRSKRAVQERGAGRVYLDFLLKVHRLVRGHGRTMQLWADILLRHPDLIPELPGDVIALEWGYQADHPFAENAGRLAAAEVPFYVCPGTSSWNTIAGRTDNAVANIWNAVESGRASGAIGFLNTDWGDNGNWQHLPVSYLGLAYGAAVSWAADSNRDIALADALDLHAFHDAAGVMGRLAYDLGNVYQIPGVITRNSSVLHHLFLRSPASEEPIARLTVEGLARTEEYLDEVQTRLSGVRLEGSSGGLISDEIRNAAGLLRHACHLGTARLKAVGDRVSDIPQRPLWTHHHKGDLPGRVTAEIEAMPSGTRKSLALELEPLAEEYRRLWLARNRPGGLRESASRWEGLLGAYRAG